VPEKKQNLKVDSLIILGISIFIIGISFYFREELAKFSSLGLVGIFLINLIGSATVFVPAPGIATVVAGGFIYNPLFVAIVSALGSAIGDFVGYALGHSSKEILLKKHSFWYKIFKETFHKYAAVFIIFFAFIPNPLFDFVGLIAGIFHYSPRKFLVYILIGRFLRNLILAYSPSIFMFFKG
jgi:membrane protein YqaA with SNARE-associated domain